MRGQLSPAEWARLARNIRAQALALQRDPSLGRGWASRRQSVLAAIRAVTGLRGDDAVMAGVLWDREVEPVLRQARDAITRDLPAEIRDSANEFTRYTGKAISDPNLIQSVTRRGTEAILSDWDRFTVGTQRLIGDTIQRGITTGAGPRVVARELSRVAPLSRSRAATIARTEYMAAQDNMRLASLNKLGVEEWVWKARPDACPICFILHGETFSNQEDSGRHPNCRCIMVPKVAGGPRPRSNDVGEANARLPERLRLPSDANGRAVGTHADLTERLVVVDNPNWKPGWRLAPPGQTKFRAPTPPPWNPPGPDLTITRSAA